MAQRRVLLPDVGEVVLIRRRKTKNIRLSINTAGQVRISLPWWVPYDQALFFAQKQKGWIEQKILSHRPPMLTDGCLIGKAHRLYFHKISAQNSRVQARITITRIDVKASQDISEEVVQTQARRACERALKQEAQRLLPQRLKTLAIKHNLYYKDVKIRKLTARWGSYSSGKSITLSYYLMQLPWPLIDYVLLHELVHTKHLHHGKDFWQTLEKITPQMREQKKSIKTYKPYLQPASL